ncbi:hypothetical protein DD238_001259 [Peronospora effusa]|uniref:Uncharacterized protein n=1 Tax=Peronospora effusa TaxID=542832 RepID=A0A3M6VJI8_9STRA|nr:hypothetical protein DD238_001259 [Peronospora effusa]
MTMQISDKVDVDYVPVEAEPLHKQRWRSETVRLVAVDFPPHTKCLYHQHLKYGVYLVVTPMNMMEYPHGEEPRPLVHEKGSVFCRDHTKDKLIHSAATLDKPAFLIEIELLKEKADVMPNGHLPLHPGIKNFKNDPECRVYGFELQNDDQAEIALNLPTEAVLVALDDCEVEITKALSDKQEDTTHQVVLKVGDDVQLLAGKFKIKFVSSASKKAQFHLVEVY